MLALVLLLGSGLFGLPAEQPFDRTAPILRIDMPAPLHGALMGKLGGMSASGAGVYNEDVTTILEPYFPKGQKIEDTRKAVHDQGLGDLQPYKGRMGPQDGDMFVTRFQLMDRESSDVFVVVHFGFRRSSSSDLVLDHVRAYLRSNNM